MAREIIGIQVDNPDWGLDDIPAPLPAAVDEPTWYLALHLAEFIASFSSLWKEYETPFASRLQVHDPGRKRARRAAYEYLYDNRCHTSIELLMRALEKFQPALEAATRLIDYGHGARAWWLDAYEQVAWAADAADKNEDAAVEVARQRRFEEHEAQQVNERTKQEQYEQALRAKENMVIRKVYSGMARGASPMRTRSSKRIDFLIITALEEERVAVLSKLSGHRKLDRDGVDTHTYYDAEVRTTREDGAVYRVIVSSLAEMGPIMGALKASAVIKRWRPEHVMMVGIAGGVDGEVALGDVMVASQVADYTIGKIHESGRREERWVCYPADANLLDAIRNFRSGWSDLIAEPRHGPGTPTRHVGVIASGGDVIASKEQIAAYLADWPKLIGVEMEGGGVAAGLHTDIERPRFLMIRGVSDLANGKNNAEVKRAWRAYACDVAAAYAIGLLREGPVPEARVTSPVVHAPATAEASGRAPTSVSTAPTPPRSIPAAHSAAPALTGGPVARVTSAAVSAATTPTWEEFDAFPRRYEVNPFDDIVLCMHPDCEREWRTIVRNARMGLQCVTIRAPAGAWHREGAPDPGVWKGVYQQIVAGVQEVRAAKQRRLHLVAKAPFSLGALLGRLIDPHDQLVVYQPDNHQGSKVWRPWGPAWPADPGTRDAPFFDLPPGLEQYRPEHDGHLAIVVDITGKSDIDPCVTAAKAWAGGQAVQPLLLRARDITEQGTVRVPADVDKAAVELERLFQQIAEALPNATLHLFYYGPLGILVRGCRRLWLRRTLIVLWDVYYDPAAHWFPAIAFPEGKLLIGEAG
ncbi:SAVED domain-containing protein [Sorangium sp. So ce1504]|uniref:phosphorylase family protein n=1 Tax=Sorangium sp. So ce1504 TaxID=3133337 RepID=UPI003F5DEE4C